MTKKKECEEVTNQDSELEDKLIVEVTELRKRTVEKTTTYNNLSIVEENSPQVSRKRTS